MLDEETGAEPRVVSASIADPYLLLIRDDSSIMVAQIDNNNELEEVEKEDDTILSTKWLAGCLYTDTTGLFAPIQTDNGTTDGQNIFMFLLSAAGALYVSVKSWLPMDTILILVRFTLFPTFQNLSTLLQACLTSRRLSPPTMRSDEVPLKKH